MLEADLGRVAVGQSVGIRADAFPDRVFAGRVQTIANRAEFTPRNVQTQKDRQNLVFAVTVRVPNPDGALKAGLPGRRHVRSVASPMLRRDLVDRRQRVHPDPPRPAHAGDRAGHAADAADPVRLRDQHHRRPHRDDRLRPGARRAEPRLSAARFFNTGYFDLVGQAGSLAQVRQAIDAGSARVGIVMPPDFSHRPARRARADRPRCVVDGSDPNTAQTALLVAGHARPARAAARPIDLRPVVLYNPSMQSINFMIPGMLGLILQFQTLMLTAFAVVRERERGTLEQLVVTPIKPWELMLGKILPYVVIAFANVFVASAHRPLLVRGRVRRQLRAVAGALGAVPAELARPRPAGLDRLADADPGDADGAVHHAAVDHPVRLRVPARGHAAPDPRARAC